MAYDVEHSEAWFAYDRKYNRKVAQFKSVWCFSKRFGRINDRKLFRCKPEDVLVWLSSLLSTYLSEKSLNAYGSRDFAITLGLVSIIS